MLPLINPMDLSGKHFVVAGASSGIGAETARQITRLGGRVSLIARREERLKSVVESLDEKRGAYYLYDFSNTDGISDMIQRIYNEQGKFDGAVYSAGVGTIVPLKMLNPQRSLQTATVNYLSFIEFVRCVTLKKYRADKMSIVGVSSTASQIGDKAMSIYCSTKAAMNGAIRAIAHELAPNVRINNVLPGWTKTEMVEAVLERTGNQTIERDFETIQYMGLIEPIDVANSIAFLLSDASRFITGTTMIVAGGTLS